MNYDHTYIHGKINDFENVSVIGSSRLERDIYCITIGNGSISAVFAAAFHGLEYLTAAALLKFAEKYKNIKEYHSKIKVHFIPMVDPDGVDIAVNGLDPSVHTNITEYTGIIDFKNKWQANAAGVDINHNFDADWDPILISPSPTKYGGEYPVSEPETKAIVDFLELIRPELFIAFHSQGKELYYDHNGMEDTWADKAAQKIADSVGYKLAKPTGTASFGGAKDWYVKEHRCLAFTAELGEGVNPLPHEQLPKMAADTEIICITAINEILYK